MVSLRRADRRLKVRVKLMILAKLTSLLAVLLLLVVVVLLSLPHPCMHAHLRSTDALGNGAPFHLRATQQALC